MVLTDLPFDRCKLLHNRYQLLKRPLSAPGLTPEEQTDAAEESKDYAAFLKAQERNVGPGGFLDSTRYSYTYTLKKDKQPSRPRTRSDTTINNVLLFSERVKQDEREYEKNIKVIEDHMWLHKQEERELKRIEGDILKQQRAVRHTLRDYENAVNKKKLLEEKQLNQSLQRFTQMSRDHLHKQEEITNQQILQSQIESLAFKDQARKKEIKISELEHLYAVKKAAIHLKRSEVMRLGQEFEVKLRQKEEEQHRLKQELSDLAIQLNLEAQKARVQKFEFKRNQVKKKTEKIQDDLEMTRSLEQKLLKSDSDIKSCLMNKGQLDADLALTKSHLDIKKRDEQRHLTDTQMQLGSTADAQRKLNFSAVSAGMDLTAKRIAQQVEVHNQRRTDRLAAELTRKKETELAKQRGCEQNFKERQLEEQRHKHQDALLFFQKMVTKGQDKELLLHTKVRTAELSRQQQEHKVQRLQQELADVKRLNASKLKGEIVERSLEEQELERSLLKEKAQLEKVNAVRTESYQKLLAHRARLLEDRHLLHEHLTAQQRLLRIGSRTDLRA
ncbi:trichohyalin-like isoform X1 [Physella acuta]|uniref:trichohyalin-like isoform X1 n=1 Tax=Physella acuta TaxID=109671 RepID=UPI0027DCC27D|nr:trichohyalin-like isoform X1 [Physella acuta]